MKRAFWLLLLGSTFFANTLVASPVTSIPLPGGYLDVDYFAGSGANTSYFVVDFAGNGGNTHAFGYRYDGAPTAADALAALNSVPGGLAVTTQDFGFGIFISKLAYLSDADEPDFSVDGRFWGYSLGTYATNAVSWSDSLVGISDRVLSNGSFDGFAAFSDFPLIAPRLPIAVPEPATATLFAIGGAGFLLRYRRRRGMHSKA